MEKVVYRKVIFWDTGVNSTSKYSYDRDIKYGELIDATACSKKYTTDEEIISYVKENDNPVFSVHKKWYSKKEYLVYSGDWDYSKVSKQDYKYFQKTEYYEPVVANISYLREHLSAEEFIEWVTDHVSGNVKDILEEVIK